MSSSSAASDPNSAFCIRPFQPQDLEQCRALFQSGQEEYQNPAEYIQYIINTDLSDVMANYINRDRSCLWVAVSVSDDEVIGLVGIRPLQIGDPSYYSSCQQSKEVDVDNEAELNRMVVSSSWRRRGVGRALLETCLAFCRFHRYSTLHLSTLADMKAATDFYKANKLSAIKVERLDFTVSDWYKQQHQQNQGEEMQTTPSTTAVPVSVEIPLSALPSLEEMNKLRFAGIYHVIHFRIHL